MHSSYGIAWINLSSNSLNSRLSILKHCDLGLQLTSPPCSLSLVLSTARHQVGGHGPMMGPIGFKAQNIKVLWLV